MTTPRQDMRRLMWISECHDAITKKGANARIVIRIQGTTDKKETRRLSAKGPRGQIVAFGFDHNSLYVNFKAAELLTSMHAVRTNT